MGGEEEEDAPSFISSISSDKDIFFFLTLFFALTAVPGTYVSNGALGEHLLRVR